ncbi:MAG: riboflavin biosynthesis protein RibF [Saccharofermentans sp.]|nr:riboflavin biosynthesis protein RibF [Saccharofermentans sp.]
MIKTIQRHYLDTIPIVPRGRIMALGLFDGMHLGHMDIISKATGLAEKAGIKCCVQTFAGFDKTGNGMLYTLEERISLIEEMGADEVLILNFPEIKDMTAEEYCEKILRMSAGSVGVVMGFDYSFGKGGAGDTEFMKRFCADFDIGCRIVKERDFEDTGKKCSTTWLKELLENGDVATASKMCGDRNYFYSGTVSQGKQLGRKLGFPTANIIIPKEKFVVRRGVYVAKVTLGHSTLYGVANVGRRPTVENDTRDIVETFIFDFDEDIYGAKFKTELLEFLRPEQAFSGQEELAFRVNADKEKARAYLKEKGFM